MTGTLAAEEAIKPSSGPDDDQFPYISAHDVSAIAVLGNGPSLRAFPFPAGDGVPTIGMNAAYRYWERIGWRPTYYCCLDEVVVESHADAIARLLDEGRIKKFFLSGRFLEIFPERSEDPRVLDLDRVSQEWYVRRGRGSGKTFIYHPAFLSCYPSLITTGSWATRWAVFLGYRYLYLFGIDGEYVPVVSGAEILGDGRLRMKETPADNPNYFVHDYQQEGDEFQIPSAVEGRPGLHQDAFRALRHDFDQQSLGCDVFCAQATSGLAKTAIFPIRPMNVAVQRFETTSCGEAGNV